MAEALLQKEREERAAGAATAALPTQVQVVPIQNVGAAMPQTTGAPATAWPVGSGVSTAAALTGVPTILPAATKLP